MFEQRPRPPFFCTRQPVILRSRTKGRTMDELVLRPATNADVPAIIAVVHAAFAEYQGQLDPPSSAHEETETTIRQKMTRARVLLGLVGEVVIGCIFYEPEGDHLYLSRLAVLPAYRQRGVGSRLLQAAE